MVTPTPPVSPVIGATSAFPRCRMDNAASHDGAFASVLLRSRRDEPAAARSPSFPVVGRANDAAASPEPKDGGGVTERPGIRRMLDVLEQRASARVELPVEPETPEPPPDAPVEPTYSESEVTARIAAAVEAAIAEEQARFEAERMAIREAAHAEGFQAGAASRDPELATVAAQVASAAAELHRVEERLRMAATREALELGLLVANTVVGLSLGDERAIEVGVRRVLDVTPERRGTIRCAAGAEDAVRTALVAHRLDGRLDVRAASDLGPGVIRFEVPDGVVESDPAEIVSAITHAIRERLHVVPKSTELATADDAHAREEAADATAA